MASTLACIGLDVDGLETLNLHLTTMASQVVGRIGGIESVRYTDESGARIVVAIDADGDTIDLVPSYDARPGALLTEVGPLGPVVQADVVDEGGELLTRLAVDLEQHRHLTGVVASRVRASVVALGLDVGVHADDAAFRTSDASILGTPEPGEEPTRFAAESLLSYGLFGSGADPEPTAFLAGVVLGAETRTHGATGQDFHVLRVRTVGFEATVCLPGSAHPVVPEPGNVVAGSCYLVVDAPSLWTVEPPRRKKRWGR